MIQRLKLWRINPTAQWVLAAIIVAWTGLWYTAFAVSAATGGNEDTRAKAEAAQPSQAATQAPPATATVGATDTPVPTNTPAPTNTQAPPTATPIPPTATPLPSLESRIEKSYRDNRGFMTRASAENMDVAITGGSVAITVRPSNFASDGDYLTVASHSALVASRAIWTTYPEVQEVTVNIMGTFTSNSTGQRSTEIAVQSTIARATATPFNYDGLKEVVTLDNKRFLCNSTHYRIHPAIYVNLGDKGCLAQWGFTK